MVGRERDKCDRNDVSGTNGCDTVPPSSFCKQREKGVVRGWRRHTHTKRGRALERWGQNDVDGSGRTGQEELLQCYLLLDKQLGKGGTRWVNDMDERIRKRQ